MLAKIFNTTHDIVIQIILIRDNLLWTTINRRNPTPPSILPGIPTSICTTNNNKCNHNSKKKILHSVPITEKKSYKKPKNVLKNFKISLMRLTLNSRRKLKDFPRHKKIARKTGSLSVTYPN